MRKRPFILLILCMVGYIMPAVAQDPQVDLPWLPYRDTNGIRTIRNYKVDTLTGERTLLWTDHYDRHGFKYDSTDVLVYDSQGRLTELVQHGTIYIPDTTPQLYESWRCKITYAPDGAVQRIENIFESYVKYEILSHKTHPKYGLLDYTFRRTLNFSDDHVEVDTVFFRREYDAQGHLLHEEKNGTDFTDIFSDIIYRYDASGRRIARRGYYYEFSDTLDYQYDAQGVLTGMKGTYYSLDMEAEVVIRCRPDGTPIESWEYWRQYVEDPVSHEWFKLSDDFEVYYTRYDSRGNTVYQKDPSGIREYEIEYWE